MIGQCAAPRDDLGLVKDLLETVDCNIREGVQGGYAALFGPTSPLTAVITVLLTIYIALLGFRLLTGRTDMRVGDLPVIGIKIGAVVLLTTSWTTYQGIVFAALFDGPAQVADQLLINMPAPTTASAITAGPVDLFGRLQSTFDALTGAAAQLASTADGEASANTARGAGLVLQARPGVDPSALEGINPIIQMRSALQGGPAFGATALWLSAVTMLISTMGLLILAKLMLGLLLAIGPLFVGMLLFESTKGFFEGWLRTALGFALMPLATIIFTAALLASIDPSLSRLAAAQAEARYDLEPVLTVLVITITFTVVFATVMGMCMRLMAGFRLPSVSPREPVDVPPLVPANDRTQPVTQTELVPVPSDVMPNRAARLAASLSSSAGPGFDRASDGRVDAMASSLSRTTELGGDRRADVGGQSRTTGGTSSPVVETVRLGQSWAANRQRRTVGKLGTSSLGGASSPARLTTTRGTR
jgi:type IV secretion system protein VirB6